MNTIRWISAILFGVVALWLIALNWRVFWHRHVKQLPNVSSWIPLLGGVVGGAAILLVPIPGCYRWCWVPLLADWGSIPGITYAVFWNLRTR